MALEVGRTHDIVVLLNNTQELGLCVKPHSYRLGRAPEFIPRMGGAEPAAGDFDWWRAFIQRDFSLGEGSEEYERLEGLRGIAKGYGVVPWPAGLGPALLPQATTMQGLTPIPLSCDADIHVVEMSGAPRLLHKQLLYTHTNELWVATHTQLGANVRTVVMHSNVMFLGFGDGQAYRCYGSNPSPNAAIYYTPLVTTATANRFFNYDHKLWRTYQHCAAYYTPASGWSAYVEVGTADSAILNAAVVFGRIYFGKENSLWCYEGGRVYEVEPFYADASLDNFSMMHASHGALYFNIRNNLYRYTGAGNIELLFQYPYEALLGPATTAQEKLFYSVRDKSYSGSLYSYDFRTRGVFRELDLYAEAARNTCHDVAQVTGLGVAAGKLWIAPMESTLSTPRSGTGTPGPLFSDYTSQDYGLSLGNDNSPMPDPPYTAYTARRICINSGNLSGLRFRLRKTGSPTFGVVFGLYADSVTKPGGALITVTIPASQISASYTWITGIFSSTYPVTEGTYYWLMVSTEGNASSPTAYYDVANDWLGANDAKKWSKPLADWSDTGRTLSMAHLYASGTYPLFGSRIGLLPTRRQDASPLGYARQLGGYLRMYTPWLLLGYPGLKKYVSTVTLETFLEGPGAQLSADLAVDAAEGVTTIAVVQEYAASTYQDHTANLTDRDKDTYVSFEWGTFASQEALFSHAGQRFYVCGAKPFDMLALRLRSSVYHSRQFTLAANDLRFYVWTGAEWLRVLATETTTRVGTWEFAQSGQLSFRPPRQWEPYTFQGYTGYWMYIETTNAPATARQNDQRLYEVSLSAHAVETQEFVRLGTITAVGNALTPLAANAVATRIAFRFTFIGSREASAFLKSFKLSFSPVGMGKQEVQCVVVARDDIERLDGVVEHSGIYIAEAIQSMQDAGLLYCIGLPYPTPHSINAQVQMRESILVPYLVYTAQTGAPRVLPVADIPLRIIEG